MKIVLSHNVSVLDELRGIKSWKNSQMYSSWPQQKIIFPSIPRQRKDPSREQQPAISTRNRGAVPVSQFPIRRVVRSDLRRASIRGRFTILSVPACRARHTISLRWSVLVFLRCVGIVWSGEIKNGKFMEKF